MNDSMHLLHRLTPQPGHATALIETLQPASILGAWVVEWGPAGTVMLLTGDDMAAPDLPWPLLQARNVTWLAPARELRDASGPDPVWALRTYRCHPGQAGRFAALLLDALPVREIYSRCAGLWVARSGDPDEVVHLWPFPGHAQRDAIRAAAAADPRWQAFRVAALPLLANVEQIMLRPITLSPGKQQ